MTLISQPWNHPTSQLVIAGSDDAMARSISFLGPMLLGSLVWDMCVTDLAAMLSAIPGHATRRKQSQAWARYRREAFYRKAEGNWSKLPFAQQKRSQLVRKATFMLSFLARATALCMLALYLAYTQGDRGMRCTVWPRAIIGLGAGATSLILACVVLNAIVLFSKTPWWHFAVLLALLLAHIGLSYASTFYWFGGLNATGSACFLRTRTLFGLFYVGAFATLLFFPLCTLRSTQDVEVRQKKEDDQPQTPSQGPGWPTKRSHTRAKTTSSFGNDVHRSLIMLRGKGRENKSDFQKLGHPSDQRPSLSFMASEEAVLQVFRSYSDSEYDSVTINELSSAACKKPFGQSFTGADTRARYNIQAEWARSQYFVWWLAALATMLCGIIVGSLNQTRVLVLLYFPVSVVFFVLVGQRLSSPPRYNLILHIQDDLTSPGSEKKQDLEPTSTAPRPRPPPFARSLSYHSSPDWHDVKGQTLTSETDCRPTSAFKHERSKLSRGFTNIQMLHPQGQQQDERGLRTRIISFVRRGSSIPILSRTKERLEDMRPSRQANWDSHDGTHPTKDSLYSVRTSGISGDAVIEVDMLKSGNGTLSKARSSRSASETLSNRHKSNYSRNDTSDSDASAATAVQQDTHSATYRAASFFDNRARSERTTVDQEPTLQEPPLPNAVFTALRPRRRPSCTSQRSALRHTSCEPTDDALRLEVTREVPEEKIGAGQAMKSVNAGTCERQVQGSSVHSMSAHICGSHTMQRPPSLSATDMQGTSTVDSFGIVKPRRVPAASQNADDAMYNPISQSALHVGDKSDSSTSCEGECGTRAIDVKDDGVANNTPKQAKQENFDGALDQGSEPERALTTREIIEMERNRRQAFQAGLLFKPVETSSSSPSRVHHDTKANKTAAFLDRPLTSSPATLTHPLKGSPGKITLEHEKEKLRAVPAIGKTTAQAQPQRRRSMSLDHQGDENLASQVVKAETKKGLKLLEEFLCQEQSLAHTPNGIQAVEADSEPAKDALTRSGEDKDSANNLIQLARSRSRRRMEKTTRQDVIFF